MPNRKKKNNNRETRMPIDRQNEMGNVANKTHFRFFYVSNDGFDVVVCFECSNGVLCAVIVLRIVLLYR